jgi:hypothetical protein
MSADACRPDRFGFVATGPGFYVWEETREAALRAARDLSPPSASEPTVTPVASVRRRRARVNHEREPS